MGKKLNKGLTALKKERPDVVADMGFKKGGMKKKGYAAGGAMPMKKNPKTGEMVPSFAMDGKGKMYKGGAMMKKKGYAKGGMMKKKGMAKGGAMKAKKK